jgi:hypothetical protein
LSCDAEGLAAESYHNREGQRWPRASKAEAVVHLIIATYFTPNKTFSDLRNLMSSHNVNPLRAFSEECRAELQALNYR